MPRKKSGMNHTKEQNMSFYGSRVRRFRKEKGISAEALARELNVTIGTIRNWECGIARPDPDCIREMFRIFGIDPNTFYGISSVENPLTAREQRILDLYRGLEKSDRRLAARLLEDLAEEAQQRRSEQISERTRPVMSLHRYVSAGGGADWEDYPEKEEVLLYDGPEVSDADEIMTVNGESMAPRFHEGDQVLVRYTTELQNGDIGVLHVPGHGGVIKEVREDRLHSLNPAFDDILPDEDGAKVIGRVIGTVTEAMKPVEEAQKRE